MRWFVFTNKCTNYKVSISQNYWTSSHLVSQVRLCRTFLLFLLRFDEEIFLSHNFGKCWTHLVFNNSQSSYCSQHYYLCNWSLVVQYVKIVVKMNWQYELYCKTMQWYYYKCHVIAVVALAGVIQYFISKGDLLWV